jgi:sulfur-carrier protein
MGRVTVLYFASLRDAAGTASEQVEAGPVDLRALYESLRARHRFALPAERMRVAVDGAFVQWSDPPRPGSEIAFIPPVSGG